MIDILLSTYNGEQFLEVQLDSIISQSNKSWKLKVRDDGSVDGTLSILYRYKQKYPEQIYLDFDTFGNVGVIKSFELLLLRSDAKYCMFADQDDYWLPNKIEFAFNEMQIQEKLYPSKPVLICSDLIVVDKDLNKLSNSYWEYARLAPNLLQKMTFLAVNNYITGCTVLINEQAKTISLPFAKSATMHDSWIALKVLVNQGHISSNTIPQIYYRQHGKNTIGASKAIFGFKYFVDKIFKLTIVVENNLKNFRQANEILGMSLVHFFFNRLLYILKR